jgi:hypothetical protein
LLAGFDPLSLTGLLCAGCAGLAVFLAMRHPAAELRRVTSRRSKLTVATVPLGRLLRGRPDALPLFHRVLLSTACAAALGLAAARIGGLPHSLVWLAVPVIAVTGLLALGWLEPRSARTACTAVVQAFDGPVADDLGRVLALLQLGAGEVSAWRAIRDHPQLGLAAEDLARSVESGTSIAEGLQYHATAARETRRAALQVRARAVGVRSVMPMMICFIPSFMLLGIVPAVASAVFDAFG